VGDKEEGGAGREGGDEVGFEVEDGGKVEVVCGFVEEEERRRVKEGGGQVAPGFEAA